MDCDTAFISERCRAGITKCHLWNAAELLGSQKNSINSHWHYLQQNLIKLILQLELVLKASADPASCTRDELPPVLIWMGLDNHSCALQTASASGAPIEWGGKWSRVNHSEIVERRSWVTCLEKEVWNIPAQSQEFLVQYFPLTGHAAPLSPCSLPWTLWFHPVLGACS